MRTTVPSGRKVRPSRGNSCRHLARTSAAIGSMSLLITSLAAVSNAVAVATDSASRRYATAILFPTRPRACPRQDELHHCGHSPPKRQFPGCIAARLPWRLSVLPEQRLYPPVRPLLMGDLVDEALPVERADLRRAFHEHAPLLPPPVLGNGGARLLQPLLVLGPGGGQLACRQLLPTSWALSKVQ
jgi:hypothetical protein